MVGLKQIGISQHSKERRTRRNNICEVCSGCSGCQVCEMYLTLKKLYVAVHLWVFFDGHSLWNLFVGGETLHIKLCNFLVIIMAKSFYILSFNEKKRVMCV